MCKYSVPSCNINILDVFRQIELAYVYRLSILVIFPLCLSYLEIIVTNNEKMFNIDK